MESVDPMKLLDTIDSRISKQLSRYTAMGEVVSVDTVGLGATVTFFGASTAIPVKRAGHVHCLPGDRVGLVKAEADWWIAWPARDRPAPASLHTFPAGVSTPDTYALASYATLPNAPTFEITKRYDASYIEVDARMGCYATGGSGTKVGIGLLIGGIDYDVTTFFINALSDHKHFTAIAIIMSGIPAGTYTIAYRWKRILGAGTLTINDDDRWSIRYTERL